MNLAKYRNELEKDSQLFWKLGCGIHENLLDEAIELIDALQKRINDSPEIEFTRFIACVLGSNIYEIKGSPKLGKFKILEAAE